jgi:hypothetical protein
MAANLALGNPNNKSPMQNNQGGTTHSKNQAVAQSQPQLHIAVNLSNRIIIKGSLLKGSSISMFNLLGKKFLSVPVLGDDILEISTKGFAKGACIVSAATGDNNLLIKTVLQ